MEQPPDESGIEIIGEPVPSPSRPQPDVPDHTPKDHSTPKPSPTKSTTLSENLDVSLPTISTSTTPKTTPKPSPQFSHKSLQHSNENAKNLNGDSNNGKVLPPGKEPLSVNVPGTPDTHPPSGKSDTPNKQSETTDTEQTQRVGTPNVGQKYSPQPPGDRAKTPNQSNSAIKALVININEIHNFEDDDSPQTTTPGENTIPKSSPSGTKSGTTAASASASTSALSPTPPASTAMSDMRSSSRQKTDASKTPSDKLPSPAPSQNEKKGLIHKDPRGKRSKAKAKRSDVAGDLCHVFGVLFAVGVRIFLTAFCVFTVWLVVYRMDDTYYWLLTLILILMVLETVNIVYVRAGQERKWFCACFMCYLLTVIPCIWILELDRLESFQDAVATNSSVVVNVAGVSADIKLDPNTLLSVTEQCLLFFLILGRWLLPRGEISRDQLSQLLFVFIGMASDVMELFQLFDESSVRQDRTLTCIILFVWSLSLLQFTLVLTMSRNPKKVRTAIDHNEDTSQAKRKRLKDTGCMLVFTQSELWSLFVTMLMQDGPFLAVRLYTIVTYELITYTIVFFICKNILVILLLFYRIIILCLQKLEKDDDDNDDGDDDDYGDDDNDSKNDENRHRSKTVSTHLSLSDVDDESSLPTATKDSAGDSGDPQHQLEVVRARHNAQVVPV